jgi:hypothetical protein
VTDLLSATSLLTTLLALLYTVWYPEIKDCIAIVPERKRADRGGQIQQVEATFYGRGLPLAAGAFILCLVLLPEVARLVVTAVSTVSSRPVDSWPPYDTLAAAFLVAYGFLLGMTYLAVAQLRHLWQQRRRLRQADASGSTSAVQ